MRHLSSSICFVATVALLSACSKQDVETPPQPQQKTQPFSFQKSARQPNEVAIDWMHAFRKAVQSEEKNPPQASRIYAYAAIGLYESVVQGMNNYLSLSGQMPGLNNIPNLPNHGKIDFELIANEAMYRIALSIFGTLKPVNQSMFDSLRFAFAGDSTSYKKDVFANSVSFGKAVAMAVLNRAANDNFSITRTMNYFVPSGNPSYWIPTGSVINPLEPYWGTLQCFAMPNGASCSVKSAIPFNTTAGSAFYNQALEVATINLKLTQQQKSIASWWADGAGSTSTPSGHWVAIGAQMAKQLNLDLGKAAAMFAQLNIAMADAFISCWNEKYTYNLLRPVSYIRSYIPGQSSWNSFITTPPFPEYPSGHSVCSGAAADVLTKMFGTIAFTDSSNISLGQPPRVFSSFAQAASEAAISRLYGGIHFREATEKGILQGEQVSKALTTYIKFKK